MISRIWHGYTTSENADTYETLLKGEIIVDIKDREIPGFREIQVFRRELGNEAVRAFAGEDYEAAYVPEKARAVLSRFDERSQHYDVREQLKAG